jgi:hypothetical protein
MALPRLREPETRPGRETHLYRDANIEAVLAQSTGQINDPECAHCAQGSGVWASCVSVPGSSLGSCANCHYNNEGNRCSLRKYCLRPVFTLSVVTDYLQARMLLLPHLFRSRLVSFLVRSCYCTYANPYL